MRGLVFSSAADGAAWYLRIMTNTEETKHDYECPTLILGVWAQIIPADAAADKLMRHGLTAEGRRILTAIGMAGKLAIAESHQVNLVKTASELFGWSIMRAKAAIAAAVELGYMRGGPPTN